MNLLLDAFQFGSALDLLKPTPSRQRGDGEVICRGADVLHNVTKRGQIVGKRNVPVHLAAPHEVAKARRNAERRRAAGRHVW